jgi:hypothetical protein
MSNYPRAIQEGVMKVPPVVERTIVDFIAKNVFWVIRDRFTAKVRSELPQHWTEFKTEMARWGVTLPRTKYQMPDDGLVTMKIPLDTTGMPDSYVKAPADRETITVVLDWKGSVKGSAAGTLASHRNFTKTREDGSTYEKSYVIIFLYRARDIDRIPSKSRQPQEIGYVLRDIMANLRHELRHVVQYALLRSRDPRQVSQNAGYRDHQADYLLSPVEYEPQIADAIYEFTNIYRIISSVGKRPNLAAVFSSYSAAKPSRLGDGFGTNSFFKTLKKNDPNRWRDAVRKLYVGVVAELTSSGEGHKTPRQ